jgi:enterobactin synthetase component D
MADSRVAAGTDRLFSLRGLVWSRERRVVEVGGVTAARMRELESQLGREIATEGMTALGLRARPLPRRASGGPDWPAGVIGSIAHADGRVAVAMSNDARIRGIGIDLERLITLPTCTSVSHVCLAQIERRWCAACDTQIRRRTATTLFSAKEAIIKCLGSLTDQPLDFLDVVCTSSILSNPLEFLLLKPLSAEFSIGHRFVVAHRFDGDFAYTAMQVLTQPLEK